MTMTRFSSGLAAALLLALLQGCGSGTPDAPATAPAAGDHGAAGDAHDDHGHGTNEAAHEDHGHDAHGHDEAAGDKHDDHGAEPTAHAEGGHDDHGAEAPAGEAGHDEHGHGEHEEGEPDFAKLTDEQAQDNGVVLAEASPGMIDAGLLLTGTLVIDPKRMASVRGRFPGLVKTMRKEVGDTVAKGEAVATVESNESLTVYSVTAPIGGVVLERHVNAGDVSGDGPLYTIGDTGALQAELLVFPGSAALVKPGAMASIVIGTSEVEGTVTSILPGLDARTQARRARVTLTGAPPAGLAAGQFVNARIASGGTSGAVVVPLSAVKQLEGRDVVFVPGVSTKGEPGFRAQPVVLGERGRLRVAIRSGLAAGDSFVTDGAFLLKAEIGKNMAAHEH